MGGGWLVYSINTHLKKQQKKHEKTRKKHEKPHNLDIKF